MLDDRILTQTNLSMEKLGKEGDDMEKWVRMEAQCQMTIEKSNKNKFEVLHLGSKSCKHSH